MLTGILVSSAINYTRESQFHRMKKRTTTQKRILETLKNSFEEADDDGDGLLTLKELTDSLKNPEMVQRLKSVNFPVEKPKQTFELMDPSG
jgi:Ca2+-binding EF-hand superfamily protein